MTHETHVAAVSAGTEGGTAGKGPLDPQGGISERAAPAAQKLRRYGRDWIVPEKPACCIAEIQSGWSFYQCTRPRGHGPDGLYCKQHDPVAVEAKRKRQQAKSAAEWAARAAQWDYEKKHKDWVSSCLQALADIAAGHNDPRKLASDLLSAKPTEPSRD